MFPAKALLGLCDEILCSERCVDIGRTPDAVCFANHFFCAEQRRQLISVSSPLDIPHEICHAPVYIQQEAR
jgi:hypothetical protein